MLKRKRKTTSIRTLNADIGRRRILTSRTAHGSEAWRVRFRRLAVVLILLTLLAVAVAGLYESLRWAGRRLLWENDAYTLGTIDVRVEGRLPRENVLEFLDLPADLNLWALLLARRSDPRDSDGRPIMAIDQIRKRFLQRVPSVSEVHLALRLPDRLDVRVEERVPFAVVHTGTRYGDFVIDRHGMVFFDPRRDPYLPLIAGLAGETVRPGSDLSGPLTPALHLLNVVRQPKFSRDIRIRRLNVAAGDHLEFWLDDGTLVNLSWVNMNEPDRSGERGLELKLDSLLSILFDNRNSEHRLLSVDLTLTAENIPVTYR